MWIFLVLHTFFLRSVTICLYNRFSCVYWIIFFLFIFFLCNVQNMLNKFFSFSIFFFLLLYTQKDFNVYFLLCCAMWSIQLTTILCMFTPLKGIIYMMILLTDAFMQVLKGMIDQKRRKKRTKNIKK